MLKRSRSRSMISLLAAALVVAACGGAGEEDQVAEPAADAPEPADADDPNSDGASDRTADEVYAEIAAMNLTYEERLAYLEEKALEEGAVLSYGSSDLQLQEPWSEAFQEAYPGINHLYVRQRSDDLYGRILAEARAERHLVDVINDNAIMGASFHAEGLLAEHHGVPIPDWYADVYLEDWAIPGHVNPHVITWNSDAIADDNAPRDWDDFLEPEHSGCVLDVAAHNFIAGMILDRGLEGAESWLEGFIDNGGQVRSGHTQTTNLLAAGEFDCAVYLYANRVEEMRYDGAPLGWHAPEPTMAIVNAHYIYKYTQRPHAAALLTHWRMDREGAQVTAESGYLSINNETELLDEHEGLSDFRSPGTDLYERLLPLTSSVVGDVYEQALDLAEEYLVPVLIN